ncbi:MAG: hypothetical protein DHS20C09_04270 [marine bacterium B5-7]|nr:MAG: hypothetical protein DHS20C09_04270 [marine bacterium B5-7]
MNELYKVIGMKVKPANSTLFILAIGLIAISLILPVTSYAYAGVSVSYYFGGHYGYSSHYYGGYGRHRYGYGYNRHRGYRYYGFRSYYSPYKNDQHYPNPTYSKPAISNNNQNADNKYSGSKSKAWDLLSQGQASSALTIFAKEAESNPKAGIPKVGYALAAASTGDLNTGVWAMRRAFQIDPDSLHYLHLDKASLDVINNSIEQYQYSLEQEDKLSNEAFMVSALNYLKHDYVASNTAVEHAIENGDKSVSVRNLQRLINAEVLH